PATLRERGGDAARPRRPARADVHQQRARHAQRHLPPARRPYRLDRSRVAPPAPAQRMRVSQGSNPLDIADLLRPESIIASVKGSGKKQVLQELSRRAAHLLKLNERAVFDTLWERERLGSTGMGNGTAIPHGKMTGIAKPVGLFARLEKPIDFEAVDERPLDLIFVLLTPGGAGPGHPQAPLGSRAALPRACSPPAPCRKNRAPPTPPPPPPPSSPPAPPAPPRERRRPRARVRA